MKIMLVDDSEMQVRIQKNILTKHGITDIIEAHNGIDAMEKLKKNPADIIFLDWHMPKMDGLTFMHQIHEHEDLKNISVIMVTSEKEDRKIQEAIKQGVKNYIIKPITEEIYWETFLEVIQLDKNKSND